MSTSPGSEATLSRLRDYATLLPLARGAATRVNLNTASAQVLYASIPGLDAAGAQRIASQRAAGTYRSVTDARAAAQAGSTLDMSWTGVTSDFFEISGRLRLDEIALQEAATVQRSRSPRRVSTLWRQRTAITLHDGEV